MSEIVFVLGAGASQEAGAPLMSNFLEKADELRRRGKLGEFKQDFDSIFNVIGTLTQAHSKSYLDLDNIESVFATIEMGVLINKLPGITDDDIAPLITSMKKLIVKTLEGTIAYPIENKAIRPTRVYRMFAELIHDLSQDGHNCSIITFNYDYALDFALRQSLVSIDYCLSESSGSQDIPLIKLHGSLNWALCPKCKNLISQEIENYLAKSNASLIAHSQVRTHMYINLATDYMMKGVKHCGDNECAFPIIIPPTWNKAQQHELLSKIWNRAAFELSNAEHIFVIGYALNESDRFFHLLHALGTIGPTRIKRYWVFNPDSTDDVKNRFKALMGGDTSNKYRYYTERFGDSISRIRQLFLN